jgi:hypothetical protein
MVETRHEIPSENTRDPAGPQDEGRGPDPKKSRESKKKIGLSGSGGSTKKKQEVEREGVEPATSCMLSKHSTDELHPRVCVPFTTNRYGSGSRTQPPATPSPPKCGQDAQERQTVARPWRGRCICRDSACRYQLCGLGPSSAASGRCTPSLASVACSTVV